MVDGFLAGDWVIEALKKKARLVITPFRKLLKREIAEVEREGRALLRFMEEHAESCEVEVAAPVD